MAGQLLAQETNSFSVDEAVAYAIKNQVNVVNARLDSESAKARVGEIRAIGLPQINGSLSLVDNPALQRMFFKVGINPLIPAGPGMKPGEVVAVPNLFQLRSSGDASITASQLIFDASYLVGLKAASTYRKLVEKQLDQSKVTTAENVKKAYYLVLVNQARMHLLDANIFRLDTLLKQTAALNKEGFVEKLDVNRLEVAYNNLLTEKSKFVNLLVVSKLLLKFQMGMPVQDSISLKDSLATLPLDSVDTTASVDFSNRPEYKLLETNKELQKLNLKKNKYAFLPNLSAFASAGYNTQRNHFGDVFNAPWYGYGRWGFSLNVPIFGGLGNSYRIKQAKLEYEKVDNSLLNLENAINFQAEQAKTTLINQLKSLETQKRNLDLAEEVTRVTKIKYQEGVGSNLELVTAENDYKEAQTNYYNALYDVIVAKIDYQKALGTLYSE